MRSAIKNHILRFSVRSLFYFAAAALILSPDLLAISCGNQSAITGDESLASQIETDVSRDTTNANFVTCSSKDSRPPGPFRAPPGVCGGIGSAGGIVCNGPAKLTVPAPALSEYTDGQNNSG